MAMVVSAAAATAAGDDDADMAELMGGQHAKSPMVSDVGGAVDVSATISATTESQAAEAMQLIDQASKLIDLRGSMKPPTFSGKAEDWMDYRWTLEAMLSLLGDFVPSMRATVTVEDKQAPCADSPHTSAASEVTTAIPTAGDRLQREGEVYDQTDTAGMWIPCVEGIASRIRTECVIKTHQLIVGCAKPRLDRRRVRGMFDEVGAPSCGLRALIGISCPRQLQDSDLIEARTGGDPQDVAWSKQRNDGKLYGVAGSHPSLQQPRTSLQQRRYQHVCLWKWT